MGPTHRSYEKMGCGGSEEKQEEVVTEESKAEEAVPVVEEVPEPPAGWVKVDVLCEKYILRMYVGDKHTVKDLVSYVAAKMKESTKNDIDCKGLTSTWALAEDKLVFCEDDHIFELDGW